MVKKRKAKASKKHKRIKLVLKQYFKHYIKLLLKIILSGVVILLFCIALIFAYYSLDLPDVKTIYNIDKQPSISIYDNESRILAVYGDLYGKNLKYEEIPPTIINAVIAIEDRRFFSHMGVDYISIIRAYLANRKAKKVVQGGSTITQQLAKIAFLNPEKTFKRKIQEMMLSISLEKNFSKQEILRIYLNRVYLGRGNFGIDAATKYYFGKDIKHISLYESAMIAAMLKAPNKYAPSNDINAAIHRSKQVLTAMKESNFISDQELKQAIPPIIIQRGGARGALKNPYFSDYVMELIPQFIGNVKGDLKVYTTLDLNMQKQLDDVINTNMTEANKIYPDKEVAVIMMDKSGKIKAMIGGADYNKSQFNRAVNAKRQPGSAFKLFVYLAALEAGYKPDSLLIDAPITINRWTPRNFSREYLGEVTLEEAFAKSINTVAVKVSENAGRQKVIDMAHRLNIKESFKKIPSIALGTESTSLLSMTSAYATISNNGYLVKSVAIRSINNHQNRIIYKYKSPSSNRILSLEVINNIKQMLRAVMRYGTGKSTNNISYNIWGKTGTTQNYKDAWFIGFDNSLITGVWIGNDDNENMKNVSGSGLPLKIWRQLMDRKIYGIENSIPLSINKNETIDSIIEKSIR